MTKLKVDAHGFLRMSFALILVVTYCERVDTVSVLTSPTAAQEPKQTVRR